MSVLVVDTAIRTLAETEHRILGVGESGIVDALDIVSTHMVRGHHPRYAVSVATHRPLSADRLARLTADLSGRDHRVSLADRAPGGDSDIALAAGEAINRTGGRAVYFPGADRLVGELTVEELVSVSAIDEVSALAGAMVTPDTIVATRDFVRPLWRHGRLVLHVTAASGGRLAPFEVPNPTPCCAGHS